ncbi:hypothetical protein, partial [Moraxella cuniculi]
KIERELKQCHNNLEVGGIAMYNACTMDATDSYKRTFTKAQKAKLRSAKKSCETKYDRDSSLGNSAAYVCELDAARRIAKQR